MKRQVFNPLIDSWVIIKNGPGKSQITNIKQRNPTIPFSGVPFYTPKKSNSFKPL